MRTAERWRRRRLLVGMRGVRVLLIIETITWKPHIETAMEIAFRARDAGTAVVYCNLRAGLPTCEDRMRSHVLLDLPEVRIGRSRAILEAQGIRYLRPAYTRAERRAALHWAREQIAGCRDIEAVKGLKYQRFSDLGWSVISSAASMTRDSQVAPATHRRLFVQLCAAAILVYEKTKALIDELAPSEVMLFNGRFATTRGVIQASEARGVRWRMHERGGDWHRYWVADCMPQDLDRQQALMRSEWRSEHAADGHTFYQSCRQRVERAWHSFTTAQEFGRIPAPMLDPGEWVSFFTSSEDEMFAIGEQFQGARYPDQLDALRAAAAAVASVPGLRFCIRVHPHIAQKSLPDQRKWANLQIPGALVIGPEDACDSYALIERSRVVCTFGSTVGVEATYWRRPSLLFSRAFYDRLDVCALAGESAQIRQFLAHPTVFPIDGALQYGAYWERLGERYIHYQPDNFHRGRIAGVYLDDNLAVRMARRLVGTTRR